MPNTVSAEVEVPVWNSIPVAELTPQQLCDAIDTCLLTIRRHLHYGGRRSGRRNNGEGVKRRKKRKWQVARAQSWLVILQGEQVRRKLLLRSRPRNQDFEDRSPQQVWQVWRIAK
jgi:hypothetical protein